MQTFAIVIPNLNQSHFLPWALESLRNQSNPFNLAIMDGGSKDNFEDSVRAYSDIIAYQCSGPDGGQAAAIKEGKEIIQGDIVAWLNADDYYFPEALKKVASCFDGDPELDVVYGDAVHVTPEGFFISYFPPIQSYSARVLTKRCFICQPACFVRRDAYERVGGIDTTLKYTMDWDLWCRLSMSGAKFQYIHEPLAAVRYYGGTKTLSSDWLRYKEIWRIERRYGHRPLPLSWPGFYRFDLSFKKEKTPYEEIALSTLEFLRKIKRSLFVNKGFKDELEMPIYGFDRLEPVVEGRCTIHLPWYGRRAWNRLYLKVYPVNNRYRVVVNEKVCGYQVSDNNCLVVQVPQVRGPYMKIFVEYSQGTTWALEKFLVDFEDEGGG